MEYRDRYEYGEVVVRGDEDGKPHLVRISDVDGLSWEFMEDIDPADADMDPPYGGYPVWT